MCCGGGCAVSADHSVIDSCIVRVDPLSSRGIVRVLGIEWFHIGVCQGFVVTGEAVWRLCTFTTKISSVGEESAGTWVGWWLDVDGAAGAGRGGGTGAISRCLCSGRPGVAVAAVFRSAALLGDRSLIHTGLPVEGGYLYWSLVSLLSLLSSL